MKNKKLFAVVGAISIFSCLVISVFALVRSGAIKPEVGLLMLVSLVGLYIGFGILIAVYRLVMKLN